MKHIIKVKRPRTLMHLDSKDKIHSDDQKLSRSLRSHKKRRKDSRFLAVIPQPKSKKHEESKEPKVLKYPSLDGGLLISAKGKEMTSEKHALLHTWLIKKLSFYWRDEIRPDGRMRRRKIKTDGVLNLEISFRPDHAMALMELERDPELSKLIKPFLMELAYALAVEFKTKTGLRAMCVQLHPEEGVLHFHITFTAVSNYNELMWLDRGVGRKGIRCLGPQHIGDLRLARAGILPLDSAELAEEDFKRIHKTHGEIPIDWQLSELVVVSCQDFRIKHKLKHYFDAAKKRYTKEVLGRFAKRPDQLKKQNLQLKEDAENARREIEQLKIDLATTVQKADQLKAEFEEEKQKNEFFHRENESLKKFLMEEDYEETERKPGGMEME
ncbi:hypothetical protein M2103_002384 [Ereboglobus sp. PH5-5]|uniref:hypothetical protein n=1 Tax=unclassified Ereboglobus TaxID=2626932 RepID=UPI0024072E45|nr:MULTISPECIES: hypothetical protein [unclassified Ereboglobus]MDF9827506.1 hypothetical protein [Ereboglobus sp. PH5-10]MDF9834147.1 hypothetical protein [Ereboglobus sp. PH5-5]